MGNSAARDARRLEMAEKTKRALALRRAGASYDDIAKELGVGSRAGIFKIVQRAIDAIPKEEAEKVLAMELERLDRMQMGLWKRASTGDVPAVHACLKIMERRAKYLGIDAAVVGLTLPNAEQMTNEQVLAHMRSIVARSAGSHERGDWMVAVAAARVLLEAGEAPGMTIDALPAWTAQGRTAAGGGGE